MATPWTHYLPPRVALSALVLLLIVPLYFLRRRYQQKGIGSLPWIAIGLLAALWVPKNWRDMLAAGGCGLALLLGMQSVVGMVIAGGVGYVAARLVPGGASVLILTGVAVAGVFVIKSAIGHLHALSRTQRLEPGQQPAGPIQLGGRIEVARLQPLPGSIEGEESSRPLEVVTWQASVDTQHRYARGELRIVGDHGVARVDPVGAELDLTQSQAIDGKAGKKLGRSLGLVMRKSDSLTLRWLTEGAEGYVRGIPEWHADPQGGSYRNSSLIPLFRTRLRPTDEETETEGKDAEREEPAADEPFVRFDNTTIDASRRVYFADLSLEGLQQRARWTLWAWGVWGAVCVAVAATQLLGY